MVTIRCRKKRKVAAALLGLTACVLIRRQRRRLDELEEDQRKRKTRRSVRVKDWIRKCCTKHVRRESKLLKFLCTGKGVIMNTTPDPDRPTMHGRVAM